MDPHKIQHRPQKGHADPNELVPNQTPMPLSLQGKVMNIP